MNFEESMKRAERTAGQYGEEMVSSAASWAPIGITHDLRERGIHFGGVKRSGFTLSLHLELNMTSRGFDYGSYQHDELLHHAVPEGQKPLKGFMDFFQTGSGIAADYRAGYKKHANDNKPYRSQFIDKGVAERFDDLCEAVMADLDWD